MAYKVAWVGTVALGVETETGKQHTFSLEEDQQIPPEFKQGDPIEITNHPDHPSVAAMGMESGGYYEITHIPSGRVFRTWHRAHMYKVEGRQAMTQARTERGDFLFRVSEFGDGTPWISTEPRRATLPFLKDALLGFDLPLGTTLQRAHEIADFLNDNLADVSITIFDQHPMYSRR